MSSRAQPKNYIYQTLELNIYIPVLSVEHLLALIDLGTGIIKMNEILALTVRSLQFGEGDGHVSM